MATLNPVTPSVTGTAPGFVAATSGGDAVSAGSNVYLLVRNGGGTAVTVTLATPGNEFNGQPIPDTAVSVPATSDMVIPVGPAYRNSSGNAVITYSAVTSVTVAALAV